MLRSRIMAFLMLTMGLLMSRAGVALADQTVTFGLEQVGGSGVRGTAMVTAGDGQDSVATLSIGLQGLVPGQSYQVHLHAGTCAQPSASTGLLGNVTADPGGRGVLTTTSVRFSAAGASTDLTLALLADGDHIIEVHGQETVACGAIPAATVGPGVVRLPAAGGLPPSLVASVLGALGLAVLGGGLLLRRLTSSDRSA